MNGAGAVRSVPKSGGTVSTLASGLDEQPFDLAVDDQRVYWVGGTSILSVAK